MLVFPLLREVEESEEFGSDGKRYAVPDQEWPESEKNDEETDEMPDDLEDLAMAYTGAITAADICRQCGCHPYMACNHADHGPCWWVELATTESEPLCSHCAMENDNELTAEEIERPWKEVNV